jgi:hypothetical protein
LISLFLLRRVIMFVTFKEQDLLGGWSIAVLVGGVLVGHIRKHGQDGSYVYFTGPDNKMNWSLQDTNLQTLKDRVQETLPA